MGSRVFNNLRLHEKGERLSGPGWEKHSMFSLHHGEPQGSVQAAAQDGCVNEVIAY